MRDHVRRVKAKPANAGALRAALTHRTWPRPFSSGRLGNPSQPTSMEPLAVTCASVQAGDSDVKLLDLEPLRIHPPPKVL